MNYRDIVRALYTKPAFRGSTSSGERGNWWADIPEEANQYTGTPHFSGSTEHVPFEGARVIPGVIDDTDFFEVDLHGQEWNNVGGYQIHEPRIRTELMNMFGLDENSLNGVSFNVDQIAEIAATLGYPGVTFKNVYDASGKRHTQYYVHDKSRRRSRFAKFEDPNSDDLMASLLLSLMGGGAGAAALTQDDRNA